MTFQKYSPWQANPSTPPPKGRTECIVQIPYQEAKSDAAEANRDHLVHRSENAKVTLINLGLPTVIMNIKPAYVRASFRSTRRPKAYFHTVEISEEDNGGEQSKCILVEQRVFDIIVVASNEDRDENSNGKDECGPLRSVDGKMWHKT